MNSFSDIRTHQHSAGDENFWSSFIGIVLIAVLIFLITSTILMLHNAELIQTIRTSRAVEKQAEQQAQSARVENSNLQKQLAKLRQQLSSARLKQATTLEEKTRLQQKFIEGKKQTIAEDITLEQSIRLLAESLTKAEQLDDELNTALQNFANAQQKNTNLNNQLNQTNQQVADLKKRLQDLKSQHQKSQNELAETIKRLNTKAEQSERTWLSPVYMIMMVAVAVFLIAAIVFFLRKLELKHHIDKLEVEKKRIKEWIQNARAEHQRTDGQLADLRQQLSQTRLQRLKILEEKTLLQEKLQESDNALKAAKVVQQKSTTPSVGKCAQHTKLGSGLNTTCKKFNCEQQEDTDLNLRLDRINRKLAVWK